MSCAVGDFVQCGLFIVTSTTAHCITEAFAVKFIVICMLALSLNGKSDVIVVTETVSCHD